MDFDFTPLSPPAGEPDRPLEETRAFLRMYPDSSLYLLEAVAGFPKNSVEFTIIRSRGEVYGVAMIRGVNLFIQIDPVVAGERIADAFAGSLPRVQGLFGNWPVARDLAAVFRERGVWSGFGLHSREVVYRLETWPAGPLEPSAVFLTDGDYDRFAELRRAYLNDVKSPMHLIESPGVFARLASQRRLRGYLADGRLVAIAAVSAIGESTGQIGGVFTLPDYRGRGIARRLLRQVLADLGDYHGLSRAVLFTNENNPARSLYESLGFQESAEFAVIFPNEAY